MTTPVSGQVIGCVQTGCAISKIKSQATMLLGKYGGRPLPSCERCAQWAFDHDSTGSLSLAPLGEYVDMFAEAKQAAFATPGQVIRGEPAAIEPPAPPQYQAAPAPVPAPRAANGFTQAERTARAVRASRSGHVMSRTTACWAAGLSSLASFAIGITLCSESVHLQQSFMTFWGIFFIAAPILTAAAAIVIWIIKLTSAEYQHYKAWKATLSPEDRRAVEIAEAAVIWTSAAALHHEMHKRHQASQARLYSSVMGHTLPDGVTPRYRTPYASQETAAGQPAQYPAGPGRTMRSDIYGNLT